MTTTSRTFRTTFAASVAVGLAALSVGLASPAQAATTTVTGTVFQDHDRDGVRDAGEGPLVGQELELWGVYWKPQLLGVTTTDADGHFSFSTGFVGGGGVVSKGDVWRSSPAMVTLDGSDSSVTVTLPAELALSAALEASIDLAKDTFAAGKAAKFDFVVSNVTDHPVSGLVGQCSGDLGDVTEKKPTGLFLPDGFTLAAGETRRFALSGEVTSSAILNRIGSVACGVSIPESIAGSMGDTADFAVTGGVSTVTGRYFADTDGDGVRDADESGILTDWEAIQLVHPQTGEVLGTSFVGDETTGEFILEVAGAVSGAELRLVEPDATRTAPTVTVSTRVDKTTDVGAIPVTSTATDG